MPILSAPAVFAQPQPHTCCCRLPRCQWASQRSGIPGTVHAVETPTRWDHAVESETNGKTNEWSVWYLAPCGSSSKEWRSLSTCFSNMSHCQFMQMDNTYSSPPCCKEKTCYESWVNGQHVGACMNMFPTGHSFTPGLSKAMFSEVALQQRRYECHLLWKHNRIIWIAFRNYFKAISASMSMTLHCSRAGLSPEIDWPTKCHADPGVSGMCHSMTLECIWCSQVLVSSIQVEED